MPDELASGIGPMLLELWGINGQEFPFYAGFVTHPAGCRMGFLRQHGAVRETAIDLDWTAIGERTTRIKDVR